MNEYRNKKIREKGNNVKRLVKEKVNAQKLLAEVPIEYAFCWHDGHLVRSMQDLCDVFSAMKDENYGDNWNREKKDLNNWVREIIGDVKLAKDLEAASSRSLAAWEVATRMAFLGRQVPQ